MQFKKNRAILAAVIAAAMSSSMLAGTVASAAGTNKYGDDTYAKRFMSLYEDVIVNGEKNGYLSDTNRADGGFGIPYHSVEELICEAPDYGHETTSEAMSYIVWIAAMHDHLASKVDGISTGDLAKAWKTLEAMIPSKDQQKGFFGGGEISAQTAKEWPEGFGLDGDPDKCGINMYPSEGSSSNVGKNPIHSEMTSNYSSEGREYLMHWLADVDDWYGFGGSARGTKGKFTYINTFNRGDQESCFETIPHPSIENLEYGNSSQGMKFAFQQSTAKSWSYTNAPDAEDRAIQAIYAANRWQVSNDLSGKAGMMGDFCRNDMFDKYYKEIGCQSIEKQNDGTSVGAAGGQHYLMSWYTAWGGAADGTWKWQIGCSHSHQFYQNPLVAYGLITDSALKAGMKSANAVKDYTTSLERQMELYLWLQSANGPFAGGCTNSWNGKYESYPSNVAKFHDMAYVEHPVYADPGSNHWTGNQFWSTQRLAELYYIIKTEGDSTSVKPGGLSLEKALETLLDNWVKFFVDETKITDDGDFSVPATLDWQGQPADWNGTYTAGANSGLTCTIRDMGNSDLGCAASLADTLVYYAKAKGAKLENGVAPKASASDPLEKRALYTAQQLVDRLWTLGRDEIGVSRLEHNGSLARFFEQEVWIPQGSSGKYPYGDKEVTNGAKFIDLRPQYEDVEGFSDLKKAWETDVAAGAKYDNTKSDCSQFTNVAAVDLHFHRFWHVGDVLMTLGTFEELYGDENVRPSDGTIPTETTTTTTTTSSSEPGKKLMGDVDCSGDVKIADAVLLARYVAEDAVTVTTQGKLNADCFADGQGVLDSNDLSSLLKFLANSNVTLPEK
ncbi:MAG: cellulose 1,4-beta-cellobiosidase [Oscillospiraceae bacterium]|nr:cellulose 1,4-beta-cellobiosidase [Oscillospiraceae bacterium]